MLENGVNFVEIDLLRRRQHTVALSADVIEAATSWDYMVCLSRAKNRDQFEYWSLRLRERLHRIAIPLEDDDPDQTLDLQKLLNSAYLAGGFDRTTDYTAQPSPRLSASDAEWADGILREAGLRS